MHCREPEVWRAKPFLDRITVHFFDMTVNKVGAVSARAGVKRRFPNDARNRFENVVQPFALGFNLSGELDAFQLSLRLFTHIDVNGKDADRFCVDDDRHAENMHGYPRSILTLS